MKYLLLVNPVSGTVSKKRIVPRLRRATVWPVIWASLWIRRWH